jgi:hypothetical protein
VILLPFIVWLADIGLYTFLEASMNECPLIKSGFTGTGIASVQGLSGLTKGDSVFILKQEKITKSFLSSTLAVNGLCTRSYPFPFQHFSCSLWITLPPLAIFLHAL